MRNTYTKTSQKYFEKASSTPLSDEIMYESFLNFNFPYYDIGSVLKKYLIKFINVSDENELKQFCSGKCITLNRIKQILANEAPLSRTEVIKLCFFFELSPDDADTLLHDFRQCSFHYRSFDDLIYAVHLKEGKSFRDAKKMVDKYKDLYSKKPLNQSDKNINYGKQAKPYFITENYTAFLKEQLNKTDYSIDSLEDFLNTDGEDYLSELSLTTTSIYFKLYGEIKESIEDSFLTILYKELDENPKFTNTDMCRLISSDTHPVKSDNSNKELLDLTNNGFLSNLSELMHYRELRKKISRNNLLILLLLHLSTIEIVEWEGEWWSIEDKELSKETYLFNKAVEYINNGLEECTFPPLHPRVPLDYMILCSLTAENPHESFTDTWKSFVENPNA